MRTEVTEAPQKKNLVGISYENPFPVAVIAVLLLTLVVWNADYAVRSGSLLFAFWMVVDATTLAALALKWDHVRKVLSIWVPLAFLEGGLRAGAVYHVLQKAEVALPEASLDAKLSMLLGVLEMIGGIAAGVLAARSVKRRYA